MKRTFTFLLALLMLLSMVPTTALAAQTEEAPAASAAAVTSESTVEAPEPTPQPEPAVPVLDEKAAQTRASGSAAGSSDIVATVPVQYYSKKGVTPDPTVMAGTTKLKKGTHYTLSYENNDAVGTDATVTITGLGTYADYKQTLPMAILKRDIAEGYAVVHNAQSFTGSPVTPEPEVYAAGSYLKAGEDYVVYYENNINAGTAKFRVVGIGNYCGTCAGTFQIETKTHYTELTGEYNGNVSGTLDMDKYSYAELVIAPGSHKFEIDHAINNTVYDHVASYQLYRIVDDSYELVKSLETEEGLHDKTAFRYDFSDIYEGETESGGALYMLSFSYVDVRGRVYSGMRTLVIPAKLPDATFLQPEMVDVQDYRHGYATAYGLNGNLGSISWQSSDPSIVSVSDGVFTMHKLGLVTLTAKSGNIEGSIQITVMAEDLSQGELFAFDVSTGKPTVIYDGRILEEGTDYTLETAQTGGLWEVAVTGTGVFTGQLIRYFDADGNATSHSHGFPSTCDAKCVRCDLQREPETEHRYETHKDEETHWQVCVYCSHKKDEAPHIYQNGNSKLCTQCGEIPAAAETPEYEYPPSDTDGELLTQLPIPGSTIVISFNTIAMGADRAGIGLAPVPGKAEGDQLAITDGMAQLEVRSEGAQYLFLLDGKYLTCGILGTTLYFSDTPTAHSRWHITPAENNNWKLINEGTQLALSFLYSFAPYPEEDNPVCSLQLYRVGDLPKLPEGISRLAAPVMLTPEQSTIDGSCLIEWVSVPYADAYEVYRSTSKTGSYTKVATVTTTFYQQELTASKTYYYKVKAVYTPDTTKNSNFSTVVSFVARLAAPTVSMTLNDESGKMVFTWEAVPGASKYEIYRRERNGSYEKVGTTTKLSYTDTKASPYVTYYYAFRSISSTISYSSDFSAEYQCMHHSPRPKVTIKLDSKDSCPVVSWEPIAGIRSYQLQYRYPGMTEFKNDSRYAGTSMKFTNAPGDSLCEYRVYPIGEEYVPLEETPYTEVSIITGIGTPVFTGWRGSNGELKFAWEAVSGAVKYELYRSTKEKKGYTLCATITDGLTYADTTVPVGKTYYYKLVAVGNLSRSKDSRICRLTPCCATPTLTVEHAESGKPMLSWEKISGAKKYTIYYSTTQYGGLKKLGTTTKTTYIHTKAKAGTTYYYRVLANASSSGNNSNYSNAVTCSVICGTPSVTAKVDAVSGKPSLSWKKVDAAVKYRILRQLPGEEDFTVIAEQTGTSYLDTAVPIDTLCIYKVQALGKTASLDGDPSREISIASGIARPTLTATVDAVTGKPVFTWTAVEGAVKYELYRSTKSTKSYSLLATLEAPGYTDDSVAPGKTYYYKLVAVGNVGKSAETAYVKLTGKCATPTITAENGTTGKPVLSWEKVGGAKKYTVYRATSETGKYTKLGTTSKLTYTDSKAKTGTQYFYKVIANGSSSTYNSSYSNMVSCNVICATPSVTVKIDAATGKPSLSWKKIDAAAGYRILRQLPGEEDFTVIAEQTAVTFKDTTAPIDTKCIYKVQVLGKTDALNGNPTKEITATSGIARPSLKTGLDAQGKPQLSWEPVEGAVKYEIYRSTKSAKSYKLLITVETPGYTDESVAPGKTYYYKVVAIGQVNKSAETSYVKLSGKCATPEISVETAANGKPVLSWDKISGAKKYTVYRATSETGKYKSIGTTKSLTYTDTKAAPGSVYFYKIVANASSSKYNSTYSNIVSCGVYCGTPSVTVKNDAATGKPVLSWQKVTGAVRYEIYLLGAEEYVPLGTVTGTSFRDDSCAPGEGRYYGVRAIASDEAWNSQVSQPDLGRATCAMPAKPTGKNALNGKPQISWSAVEGATRYVIYRSTSKSKGYKAIDETDSLTFTDISTTKGKAYYYKIAALCEETESAQSAYVKVTCKASSRPISYSTCKDKGSKTVWDFARFNGNRLDAYEERDASRSFFLQNLSAANGSMYYLEEEEMRMFVGKTYGMPIVTSRELAEATVWTSSDPTVATVNEVGFVTPLKEGTVTITATMPGEAPVVRTCRVHVINYPAHTYAELEAQAKVEAKRIADYVMAYPGLTTDMDRIALAAKIINELYVANGMGASLLEIKNGDIVETMIPGYNQPYGTLVTFHSSCAGDVRALGMVLEYMGFDWYHANADKWVHQWCIVYDVDGQTAFADGSMYGIAGYGERKEDGSNWLQFNGPLTPLN